MYFQCNILRSPAEWVPKHLCGVYLVQVGARDRLGVPEGQYSLDLYFQHRLLPLECLQAWNDVHEHAPAKIFGCDLFQSNEPENVHFATEAKDIKKRADPAQVAQASFEPSAMLASCECPYSLLDSTQAPCSSTSLPSTSSCFDEKQPTPNCGACCQPQQDQDPSVGLQVDEEDCPPRTQKAKPKASKLLAPETLAKDCHRRGAKRILVVQVVSETELEKVTKWRNRLALFAADHDIELVHAVELSAPLRVP